MGAPKTETVRHARVYSYYVIILYQAIYTPKQKVNIYHHTLLLYKEEGGGGDAEGVEAPPPPPLLIWAPLPQPNPNYLSICTLTDDTWY